MKKVLFLTNEINQLTLSINTHSKKWLKTDQKQYITIQRRVNNSCIKINKYSKSNKEKVIKKEIKKLEKSVDFLKHIYRAYQPKT